jgi:hypothetical protein
MSWKGVRSVTLTTIECRQLAFDYCRLRDLAVSLANHEGNKQLSQCSSLPLLHKRCSLIKCTYLTYVNY